MSEIAIRVGGLGKEFQIGAAQQKYDRFGEQIVDAMWAPIRRAGNLLRGRATGAAELEESFWALRDVSLDISHGEVVGIIGRNGAGKSTLLKILSRITEPSTGYAEIHGRVGSLLEVGTGFHPELTGRENIFLNGAILGLKRHEIVRKFDEIVDFSEIEQFIDTPVKHYSSGMYVRLAFSVAAHLEPEILLVDEVLAVGDVAFQQKCLGKMSGVAQEGRTVLFVSHNMSVLQNLCERGVYLDDGGVACDDEISAAVDAYLRSLEESSAAALTERTDRTGAGMTRVSDVRIENKEGVQNVLQAGAACTFSVYADRYFPDLGCAIDIFDAAGQPVVGFNSQNVGPADRVVQTSPLCLSCTTDQLQLLPGRYRVDIWLTGDNRIQDSVIGAAMFDVVGGNLDGRPTEPHKRFRVTMPHRWTVQVDGGA